MRTSYKIAFGGITMALCVVLMSITTVFPFASFALPGIAGALLIPIAIKMGKKWAALVYIGVSFLSFMVSSDHTAIISFVVLLGYYPILKGVIESMRKPVIEWIIKILTFNVAIILGVLLTILFFGAEVLLTEYKGFGAMGVGLFILAGNFVFVLYDIALSRVVSVIFSRLLRLFNRFK